MNHNIKQMFVVKLDEALLTSGDTSDLAEGQVGIFDKNFSALAAAPSPATSPYIFIAQGTGDNTVPSFKSSNIFVTRVTAWRGVSADTTTQEQITYVGWDEINQGLSPDIHCDRSYTVILRIFEHYLQSVYRPALQEGVVVKAPCCDDCGTNCDSLDCSAIFTEFADKINANPRLSPYITASAVTTLVSGSPATTTFALVLPDPGTSLGTVVDFTYATSAAGLTPGTNTGVATTSGGAGTGATFTVVAGGGGTVTSVTLVAAGTGYEVGEVLTIAGTDLTGGASPADDIVITVTETTGAEGELLGAIRDFYSAQVDNAETDIIFSADAESSDSDVNATGNVMIEMTPSAGVELADLEPWENIAWIDITAEDDAVYACGLKLVGKTPAGLTAVDCLPDSVAYIANKTRFKVFAGEAPESSQDLDMEDFCDLWAVKNTQDVKYPIGEGPAIVEMERHFAGNNQPGVSNHRYWIPFYNGDLITFADGSLTYDIYEVEYLDPSPIGFEHHTLDGMSVLVAVPDTMTAWKTAFETVMNTYLANSPSYQGTVTL